jgi:hypothetical protein
MIFLTLFFLLQHRRTQREDRTYGFRYCFPVDMGRYSSPVLERSLAVWRFWSLLVSCNDHGLGVKQRIPVAAWLKDSFLASTCWSWVEVFLRLTGLEQVPKSFRIFGKFRQF